MTMAVCLIAMVTVMANDDGGVPCCYGDSDGQ